MNLQLSSLGLQAVYRENKDARLAVRMMGALQFTPLLHLSRARTVIRESIDDAENLTHRSKTQLKALLRYYKKTWIKYSLGLDFFSLHAYFGPRTNNVAESYHGHQHRQYRKKKHVWANG
jgi:hypothetical protein